MKFFFKILPLRLQVSDSGPLCPFCLQESQFTFKRLNSVIKKNSLSFLKNHGNNVFMVC